MIYIEATVNNILREWRDLWPGGLEEDEYSTLNYIAHCRHGALGFNVAQCAQCKDLEWFASSCGNRHCPCCLGPRQAQWSQKVCDRLPDCSHFHTVFTTPKETREFFKLNYRIATEILFNAASDTLKQFQANNWGVDGAFFGVYHSWAPRPGDSQLNRHPHLHVLVSSGGRDRNTGKWKQARVNYLFPVRAMSKVYGAIFVRRIEELESDPEVKWPKGLSTVEARRDWRLKLAGCAWYIHNRPTLKNTRVAVRYLARYTSRIAISNQRIKAVDTEKRTVTFQWKDYRDGGQIKESEIDGAQFIRRFSHHLVPKGFRRIRYYGLLCGSKERLASVPGVPAETIGEQTQEPEPRECECCGGTTWNLIINRARPFDVTPQGTEIKSFSLGVVKKHPPPPD